MPFTRNPSNGPVLATSQITLNEAPGATDAGGVQLADSAGPLMGPKPAAENASAYASAVTALKFADPGFTLITTSSLTLLATCLTLSIALSDWSSSVLLPRL